MFVVCLNMLGKKLGSGEATAKKTDVDSTLRSARSCRRCRQGNCPSRRELGALWGEPPAKGARGGASTHRGSDIKADTIGQGFRDTKGKGWKSEKRTGKRVFQAKETSCAKKCRLEGNVRTMLLNHPSLLKRLRVAPRI